LFQWQNWKHGKQQMKNLTYKKNMVFKNQKELFHWIWENRPHISELSEQPLIEDKDHFLWIFQFLHVLPKGSYPAYKLNPKNILLGTAQEHTEQESNPVFRAKYDELKQQYYKDIYHKTF
jgi:hypothetical protein